jgi:Fic family protein
MVFVRRKKINGREYYYLVKSTRLSHDKWKKIERYIGLNPPTDSDLKRYEKEFDNTKEFLISKKEQLNSIRELYIIKMKKATKDELMNLESEIVTRFTYDTNRIEGSTLTYKDTKLLLQDGVSPREKPIRDIKEAENHKKAFYYMKDNLSKEISKELILNFHKVLKNGVSEDAGAFRDAQVRVGYLVPIKSDMIEIEIKNLISWHKGNKHLHPLELATVFHSLFERIHPFFDGNGRIGRLLLNFIMIKNNYPIIIVQNKNKRRYHTALRYADNGNYLFMIKYLFSELEKQAKEYYL